MTRAFQTATGSRLVAEPEADRQENLKTPPLLLGATLVFWGWQTGFLIPGVVLGLLLEGARWLKPNWEFSDDEFVRIWTFCTLLCLGATVYAFTANDGPADFRDLFAHPNLLAQRNAGTAGARTFAALFRWLPMIFFLFIGAQVCSSRAGIPLETLSLIMRWRWKRAQRLGLPPPVARSVDIGYPYFGLCLFATSNHPSENSAFFWGLCLLVAWALWPHRSRRFGLAVWAATLVVAIGLGYLGQHGLGHLQGYLTNLNPSWLTKFSRRRFDFRENQTELGRLGRVKTSSTIIIRLARRQGPIPTLLREASYRTFKVRTWDSNLTENDFARQPSASTNEATYELLPGKTNADAINIACYLAGGKALLPLPAGSGRLENLMAYEVGRNPLGAVLVQGPGLVMFDAYFGNGALLDSPADTNLDLTIPRGEEPALRQVVSTLGIEGLTPSRQLRALRDFFRDHFAYSTWQEPAKPGRATETPLTWFLLHSRKGHCEYFATAGALLLRQLGIPTRYAVGYAVHEAAGQGKFVVRERDAHAWCLAWDDAAKTWRDVDFTPASWVEVEASRASPFQWVWDAWGRLTFELSKLRWGQNHWRQYVLWGLAPVLAVLLYQIVFRTRRRRLGPGTTNEPAPAWPGLDSEFYQLERQLIARGFVRRPSEPLSGWLQRAYDQPELAELRVRLQTLLRLHYRYRFDPQGLDAAERESLRHEAQACRAQMMETAPGGR